MNISVFSSAASTSKTWKKISPDQLQLILEGFEEDAALAETGSDGEEVPDPAEGAPGKKRYPSKRTVFPANLPERIIEIDLPEDEWICPITGEIRAFLRWEEPERSGDRLPLGSPQGERSESNEQNHLCAWLFRAAHHSPCGAGGEDACGGRKRSPP